MDIKLFTDNIQESLKKDIENLKRNKDLQGEKVRLMPDAHPGANVPIGFTTTLTKSKIDPKKVGVDLGCLDMETEFLTEEGWKKISEYSDGDKVMQYDKESDTGAFVSPINYIDKKCDYFYHFKNSKGLDQMVSEEHKMLIWKGYKNKGYNTEDYNPVELINKGSTLDHGYYGVKCAFNLEDKEGLSLSDSEIRLNIAISADGSLKYKKDGLNRIYMHLKKNRKIKRIQKLLNKLSITFKKTDGQDGSTHIYFYTKLNKDISKYWKANRHQLKIVAEESLKWDGSEGYRSYFCSNNKDYADVIQYAFSATNRRAGISTTDYEKKNWNRTYSVTPTKNNIIGVTNTVEKVESKDGRKYCFTVPSGYFIARRNGKIFITGNCGVTVFRLGKIAPDLDALDDFITNNIPHGRHIHDDQKVSKEAMRVIQFIAKNSNIDDYTRAANSLGTLGGGNHFISLSRDDEDVVYLTIHSGSRGFGYRVAKNWYKKMERHNTKEAQKKKDRLIESYKEQGRQTEIEDALNELEFETGYLKGIDTTTYYRVVEAATVYASINRNMIADKILNYLDVDPEEVEVIESTHNYIGDDGIMRKGAISAHEGEKVVIPINVRDGIILGTGKGNEDWNFSAPHGAGRLMSRTQAKAEIEPQDIECYMKNQPLDEMPQAYRSIDSILPLIKPAVEVDKVIKPFYNFQKQGGKNED